MFAKYQPAVVGEVPSPACHGCSEVASRLPKNEGIESITIDQSMGSSGRCMQCAPTEWNRGGTHFHHQDHGSRKTNPTLSVAFTTPYSNMAATAEEFDRMQESLREIRELCAQAQDHYLAAKGFEATAERYGERAKFFTIWDGSGLIEEYIRRSTLSKRKQAMEEVVLGTEVLRRAFELTPPRCLLQETYPKEMSEIDSVPIPNWEEGETIFAKGRDFRANLEDPCVQLKIRKNLEVIRQCERLCERQQHLLSNLSDRIVADRSNLLTPIPTQRSHEADNSDTQSRLDQSYAPVSSSPKEFYIIGGDRRYRDLILKEEMLVEEFIVGDREKRKERGLFR